MTSVLSARRGLQSHLENALQPLLELGWQPDGRTVQHRGDAVHPPSASQLMRRADRTVEIEYAAGGLTVHHHPLADRLEPRLGLVYDLRRYSALSAYQAEGLLR